MRGRSQRLSIDHALDRCTIGCVTIKSRSRNKNRRDLCASRLVTPFPSPPLLPSPLLAAKLIKTRRDTPRLCRHVTTNERTTSAHAFTSGFMHWPPHRTAKSRDRNRMNRVLESSIVRTLHFRLYHARVKDLSKAKNPPRKTAVVGFSRLKDLWNLTDRDWCAFSSQEWHIKKILHSSSRNFRAWLINYWKLAIGNLIEFNSE